jgi:6-phosphofructokinase 1
VDEILHQGGTILGTSRTNLYKKGKEGDISKAVNSYQQLNLEALIAIGGDDTLEIAYYLGRDHKLNIVGVPKTIDNDVGGTAATFGFDTAVQTATDAIDKLHSTAESHERVMVVEVMGRHAGWIALSSGLAGSADVILIPEIPFDLAKVCDKIRQREAEGRHFSIVVVAEGAVPVGGGESFVDADRRRLGGVADKVARTIEANTGKETRSLVLGHLQRGGSPTTFDRLLALRFGAAAVRLIAQGRFDMMVALDPPEIVGVPLADVLAKPKLVPVDSDTVLTARDLGISFGD